MNRRVFYTALVAIICQIAVVPIFAVSAYPYPIVVTQPDGSQLTIRLQGDEFQHVRTTEDGYILKQNSDGYYTYATVTAAGEIVGSKIIARDINRRNKSDIQFLQRVEKTEQISRFKSAPNKLKQLMSQSKPQKAFPAHGSQKSLVILVNFTDRPFAGATPKIAFDNLLNQENYSSNGGTGSARDYFLASSYGKFSPTFDVVGPFTLPNNMKYYGENDSTNADARFIKAPRMIVDACTLAHNAGLDFSQYDLDNNDTIDNVFIFYAGYNEAETGLPNTIWPHRWDVQPGENYSGTTESITFDGKLLYGYACTSELRWDGQMCGIGTFCHEFGHVIGLADYYHTADSKKATIDQWTIMARGNYLNWGRTPPTYSVFDRYQLGWLTPQEINSTGDLFLNPIYQGEAPPSNTNNQAFIMHGKTNPNEYFMLEYRKLTGWDSFLPNEGMLIWHIDYDANAWENDIVNNYTGTTQTASDHMRVYLEPTGSLPPPATPGSPFPNGVTTSFIPKTWSGTDINRELTDITKTADKVSFKIMSLNSTDIKPVNNADISLFSSDKTIYISGSTPDESIEIYNTTGLRVYSSKITSSPIQLSNLSNGIYIVKIGLRSYKVKL